MPIIKKELKSGHVILVDQQDAHWLDFLGWRARKTSNTYYAQGNKWNSETRGKGFYSYHFLHRLILDCGKGKEVDHINGNGLDNRRSNLRVATVRQNQWNSSKHRDSFSKFKGVVFYKDKPRKKPWAARINNSLIGFYPSEIEAALAYDKSIFALRGDFARLNFPL